MRLAGQAGLSSIGDVGRILALVGFYFQQFDSNIGGHLSCYVNLLLGHRRRQAQDCTNISTFAFTAAVICPSCEFAIACEYLMNQGRCEARIHPTTVGNIVRSIHVHKFGGPVEKAVN